jgi:EAL domain-containing protein (putative c-di-GMP-specific phosphodiesterase class I)
VLRAACAQIKAWQEAGMPSLYIAVNLSAQGFHRADLAGGIARVFKETGLDPRCIEVEITESTAMQDIERTVEHLSRLAEMGVGISIDDFGTGYSSLSYLKKLPIQKLKIDKSFIQDIATDPDDRTIISAVVALAHNMKIRVVAEGVETEAQLSFLREVGCQEMQGYLISAALPAEEFQALVLSRRE